MIKSFQTIIVSLTLLTSLSSVNVFANVKDDKIKDQIIQQSIENYSGSCPCPYFVDRAGKRCGGRSAYSRDGGASPFCYRRDVSDEMVRKFKVK